MINLRPCDGIIHNYSSQGWEEFKKWLDGTYGRLKFVYEDQGESYEIITIDDKVYRTLSINKADATEFETDFKQKANEPIGIDSSTGIQRVAVQSAAIPIHATEFCLGCTGELNAGQSVETISDIIPLGETLHILMARASCRPMQDAEGIKNYLLVELLWKETWDDEDFYHLFGKSYLELECSADFPASFICFDGAPMIGDGETTRFIIRRTIIGNCDTQDTLVAVRGYTVEE